MLSVIIVSYNTKDLTRKCLAALLRSKGVEMEVILVDNASTDGSAEMVEAEFKDVKLIKNSKNGGYAKANNLGMSKASGDLILLLNSDAFVFEDTLDKIIKFQESNAIIDVFGCQLLNRDGTLQRSWGYFPTLRRIFQMMLLVDNLPIIRDVVDSIHVRSEKRYVNAASVDWVTGAFVLLKKSVFDKTGGIDEKYFMYGEEMEWMYRIKKNGFKVFYTPDAQCIHLLGASSTNRDVAITGEIKGWVYWYSKHNSAAELKLLAVIVWIGCMLRQIVKRKHAQAYRKAANEIVSAAFGQTD